MKNEHLVQFIFILYYKVYVIITGYAIQMEIFAIGIAIINYKVWNKTLSAQFWISDYYNIVSYVLFSSVSLGTFYIIFIFVLSSFSSTSTENRNNRHIKIVNILILCRCGLLNGHEYKIIRFDQNASFYDERNNFQSLRTPSYNAYICRVSIKLFIVNLIQLLIL